MKNLRKIYRLTLTDECIIDFESFYQAFLNLIEYYKKTGCWTQAEVDEFYEEFPADKIEKELKATGCFEFYNGDNIEVLYKQFDWKTWELK